MDDVYYTNSCNCVDTKQNNIVFHIKDLDVPIIELKENGDIFVKGNLIENDKELVNALSEFINGC